MSRPSWARPIRTEEEKIPQFPDTIVIGGFRINTTSTGALETKPVGAPPSQDPADLVQPASLRLADSAITLEASAEFGGTIVLKDLLNKLLDLPIYSVAGVEMPIRSLFGSLFSRVAGVEGSVADISGVRLAAEEAKSALNDIKDAMQDVSGALLELATATAASDLAGVLGRVTALEAVPPADLSSVESRLTTAETAIISKASQIDVDSALAAKASAAEVSALDTRVGSAESSLTSAGGRLDALESALPGKVSQGDYDVYVAANDAAVGAAAAAAGTAQAAADAAAIVAAAAEVKGLVSKMIVETHNTAGVSSVYWGESIGAILMTAMEAGKVAEYIFDGPATVALVPNSAATDKVLRLRNGNSAGLLTVTLGGSSYEIVEKETVSFHYDGAAWRLM
jgi:hypothetical protein